MKTNTLHLKFLCIGCIYICAPAASICFPQPLLAGDHEVTVRIPVATRDIDFSQPAGVRRLYGRLRDAARIACRDGYRLGLEPVADFTSCFEKSLGEAVRAVNQQRLTELYLETHRLQDTTVPDIATRQRAQAYLVR